MSVSDRCDLGAWPLLGYVDSPLDRACHLRSEMDSLFARRDARVYLIGGELVAARRIGEWREPLFEPSHAEALGATSRVFLGLVEGAPRFAMRFDPGRRDEMEAAGLVISDLRSLAVGALLPPPDLAAIACGKAMLTWHGRHRYCANCGQETGVVDGGWRRDCSCCGAQHFPRTDPVVIMLAYRQGRCLLGRQPQFTPQMWSCLAGFVEPGETIEDAVRRELAEETGIATGAVTYRWSQPWPFPMSLMIGCLAEAVSDDIVVDKRELEDARWFARDDVARMLAGADPAGLFTPPPLAIAHHLIRAFVDGV